jgi:hypothetical protein
LASSTSFEGIAGRVTFLEIWFTSRARRDLATHYKVAERGGSTLTDRNGEKTIIGDVASWRGIRRHGSPLTSPRPDAPRATKPFSVADEATLKQRHPTSRPLPA